MRAFRGSSTTTYNLILSGTAGFNGPSSEINAATRVSRLNSYRSLAPAPVRARRKLFLRARADLRSFCMARAVGRRDKFSFLPTTRHESPVLQADQGTKAKAKCDSKRAKPDYYTFSLTLPIPALFFFSCFFSLPNQRLSLIKWPNKIICFTYFPRC